MAKKRKIKKSVLFPAIAVCIIASAFLFGYNSYSNKDESRDKAKPDLVYEANETSLGYKRNNKTKEPFVNSQVINGVANITIGAGFGETRGSTLEVSSVSQSIDGPKKIIHISINQDFNDTITKPYNPSIIIKIPEIKPGKFVIKGKIDKRKPNFSQNPVKMDTLNSTYIQDEFSYSIR